MRCDVLTNTVFDTNEVIFLKYLEEGVDIGAEQRENSIIINMLDKNIDISIISEVTGRLIKDIEEIKKAINLVKRELIWFFFWIIINENSCIYCLFSLFSI